MGKMNKKGKKVQLPEEEKTFDDQEMVWVKLGTYPWWPGYINKELATDELIHNKKLNVAFFGEKTHAYVSLNCIRKWVPNYETFSKYKGVSFIRALKAADSATRPQSESLQTNTYISPSEPPTINSEEVIPDKRKGRRKGKAETNNSNNRKKSRSVVVEKRRGGRVRSTPESETPREIFEGPRKRGRMEVKKGKGSEQTESWLPEKEIISRESLVSEPTYTTPTSQTSRSGISKSIYTENIGNKSKTQLSRSQSQNESRKKLGKQAVGVRRSARTSAQTHKIANMNMNMSMNMNMNLRSNSNNSSQVNSRDEISGEKNSDSSREESWMEDNEHKEDNEHNEDEEDDVHGGKSISESNSLSIKMGDKLVEIITQRQPGQPPNTPITISAPMAISKVRGRRKSSGSSTPMKTPPRESTRRKGEKGARIGKLRVIRESLSEGRVSSYSTHSDHIQLTSPQHINHTNVSHISLPSPTHPPQLKYITESISRYFSKGFNHNKNAPSLNEIQRHLSTLNSLQQTHVGEYLWKLFRISPSPLSEQISPLLQKWESLILGLYFGSNYTTPNTQRITTPPPPPITPLTPIHVPQAARRVDQGMDPIGWEQVKEENFLGFEKTNEKGTSTETSWKDNIKNPTLRKKVCQKLACLFEYKGGIQQERAQIFAIKMEAKLRIKDQTMGNIYKETLIELLNAVNDENVKYNEENFFEIFNPYLYVPIKSLPQQVDSENENME